MSARAISSRRLMVRGLLPVLGCAVFAGCSSAPAPLPEPAPTPAPEVDERYAALPAPAETPNWTPPSVAKTPLESGLTLWHLEQHAAPLVSIQLVLPVGSAADPTDKAGLSLVTADMLDEGAGNRSALELSEELGRLATDYNAQTGVDYVLLSMNALAENLDASLGLLADIVLRPNLPSGEFDRRKKHHEAAAMAAKAEPRSRLNTALGHVLFGEGYAGAPARGTLESISRITLHDVKKRAREMTTPAGAHLVLAGDIDATIASSLVDRHFGDWKGTAPKIETKLGKAAPAGRAYVVNFPGAAQSALAIAKPAGDAHDPNYFAEMVMNQKIGESFTSRINLNLREDKGYTYGARSHFQRYRHAGYYAVTTNVLSEVTAASVYEIRKELKDVCGDRPLTRAEHSESINGLLLGYPTRFARVDTLGLRVASLPIYDRPADFWTTWPDEVSKIDLERANAAAAPYCSADKYRIVIAGDLLKIQPSLEKLGLEVVELDRNGRLQTKE